MALNLTSKADSQINLKVIELDNRITQLGLGEQIKNSKEDGGSSQKISILPQLKAQEENLQNNGANKKVTFQPIPIVFTKKSDENLALEKEKKILVEKLAGLCKKEGVQAQEVLVAKFFIFELLYYKNGKTIREITQLVRDELNNNGIGEKMLIEKFPQMYEQFNLCKDISDEITGNSLTEVELKNFYHQLHDRAECLQKDGTAANVFSCLLEQKLNKNVAGTVTTEKDYIDNLLRKLKTYMVDDNATVQKKL